MDQCSAILAHRKSNRRAKIMIIRRSNDDQRRMSCNGRRVAEDAPDLLLAPREKPEIKRVTGRSSSRLL